MLPICLKPFNLLSSYDKTSTSYQGDYQREPHLRTLVGDVPHLGDDHVGSEWIGNGCGNDVRANSLERSGLAYQESNTCEGAYPLLIVVIASFVTIVQLCMEAFMPDLYATLGVFIPLIVVNCVILGRAEAFASKNGTLDSALDGIGMGVGFTLALTLLGAARELLGSGSLFGAKFIEGDGMLLFVLAPGAFIALGYLLLLFNKFTAKLR